MAIRKKIALWGLHVYRSYRTFSVFLPIFKRPIDYLNSKAVIDKAGSYTHGELLRAASAFSNEISARLKGQKQHRVAFFAPSTAEAVIITWAIWMSGQIAVPLPSEFPTSAHQYFINDSDPSLIIVTEENKHLGEAVKGASNQALMVMNPQLWEHARAQATYDLPERTIDDSAHRHLTLKDLGQNDDFYRKAPALIVYTSGTTPKGVVFTHSNLHAQVSSVVDAWRLSKRDCLLQAVPMEQYLTLMAPLAVGASVVILENLKPENVWVYLLGLRMKKDERPNIILLRSTMFPELIGAYEKCLKKSDAMCDHVRNKCMDRIRFFSVGNGPVTREVSNNWQEITGHRILSHFSMAETGIVMSMPIYGCKSGSSTIGMPMPGIHIRLTNESGGGLVAEGSRAGTRVLTNTMPATGLMEIRGENILSGYWRKPTISRETISRDGWFKTSDMAKYSRGMYSVMGHYDTDVYRKGNQMYSIPLIEAILLNSKHIKEVAVIENRLLRYKKLMAFVVSEGHVRAEGIIEWINSEMPDIPIEVEFVNEIPKNWSGKKNRQKILELFDAQLKNQHLKEKAQNDTQPEFATVTTTTQPRPAAQAVYPKVSQNNT